MPLEVGIGFRL